MDASNGAMIFNAERPAATLAQALPIRGSIQNHLTHPWGASEIRPSKCKPTSLCRTKKMGSKLTRSIN